MVSGNGNSENGNSEKSEGGGLINETIVKLSHFCSLNDHPRERHNSHKFDWLGFDYPFEHCSHLAHTLAHPAGQTLVDKLAQVQNGRFSGGETIGFKADVVGVNPM